MIVRGASWRSARIEHPLRAGPPHNCHEQRLGVGDTAFFPKGSWSVWEVREDVRKVAVCRDGMPKVIELGMRAWHWSARRANALLSRGNGHSTRADPFAAAPRPEQNPLQ